MARGADSEPLQGRGPAGARDAGALAPAAGSLPRCLSGDPGASSAQRDAARNRMPLAPHILARVKAALERLDNHRGWAGDAG